MVQRGAARPPSCRSADEDYSALVRPLAGAHGVGRPVRAPPRAVVLRSRTERMRTLGTIRAALAGVALATVALAALLSYAHGPHGDQAAGDDHGPHARRGRDRRPDAQGRPARHVVERRGRDGAGRHLQRPHRIGGRVAARCRAARAAVGPGPAVDGDRARDPQSADDHQGRAAASCCGPTARPPTAATPPTTSTARSIGSTASSTRCSTSPGRSASTAPGRAQRGLPFGARRGRGRGADARRRPRSRSGLRPADHRRRAGAHGAGEPADQCPRRGRRPPRRRRGARGPEYFVLAHGRVAIVVRDRGVGIPPTTSDGCSIHTSRRAAPAAASAWRSPRTSSRASAAPSRPRGQWAPAPRCGSSCRIAPATRDDDADRASAPRRRRGEDREDAGPRPARRGPPRDDHVARASTASGCWSSSRSTCSSSTTGCPTDRAWTW